MASLVYLDMQTYLGNDALALSFEQANMAVLLYSLPVVLPSNVGPSHGALIRVGTAVEA